MKVSSLKQDGKIKLMRYCNFSKSGKKRKLIFCDTTDSSSWIKAKVFDYVDKYAKGQILKNKQKYLRPIYANRVYADFTIKNIRLMIYTLYTQKS